MFDKKMAANHLVADTNSLVLDKWRFDDAECKYQIVKNGGAVPVSCQTSQSPCKIQSSQSAQSSQSSLVNEIAKARQHIQKSLKDEGGNQVDNALVSRLQAVELDNNELRKVTQDLQAVVKRLEARIKVLEVAGSSISKAEGAASEKEEDDDDDVDLFGSDSEEDEAYEKAKQERVKAYQERKGKKPTVTAKSNIILDVKPWDDETDMAELEKVVRKVTMDGLLWGTGKLVPVGYGIKKLSISCVVEDEKVSMDDVEEQIVANEDIVQSVDIVAFNKI